MIMVMLLLTVFMKIMLLLGFGYLIIINILEVIVMVNEVKA